MNVCIHHYPILLFYAVFSLSLFDIIVILRPLRFRSIYHNSFLTPLYVSYFRVCSLAHWIVASIPPSYNLFFPLITLIWLLSSIYEKISVAYLIQFSLFVLLFLIAAVFGENFMMIAALFQLIILGYLSGYGVIWFARFVRWSRCVRGAVKFLCHLPTPERTLFLSNRCLIRSARSQPRRGFLVSEGSSCRYMSLSEARDLVFLQKCTQ